jgi:UDP-3-O-[3-hydroxymyristoyl] N-acetylglucosamine deacetylase/3-hydroxyacyl-[acyl-carrier-protein] dehydratase
MARNTIGKEVQFSGIGLHTGQTATVRLVPADTAKGIVFIREDLPAKPRIPAEVSSVNSTVRSTTLKSGDAGVSTVEHLMAALYASEITDVEVFINGPEVPILDGSSHTFFQEIQKAGLAPIEGDKECLLIETPLHYKMDETGSEYWVYPHDKLKITVILDFPDQSLGEQSATMHEIAEFGSQIACCRTFVMLSELEALANAGLIKGGDLDNAIVIVDQAMDEPKLESLRQKLNKPGVQMTEDGILNTVKLQFRNEPARHKILDLLGDIALFGKEVKGHIIARRPGHRANHAFASMLKSLYLEQKKLKGKPKYNPEAPALMDVEAIQHYLPHRYPFLFVDKIIEISDKHIVGVKNVTMNEYFFQGHFPGNAIFPGVLQMEAMAQTGGILALNIVGDPGHWDTYFLKMDGVKFKAKVVPGDTLLLKMELLEPIRRGIVRMQGTAYVGNKIVSEGELTAQIIKRKYEE